jgi:hypothetical protein
MQSSFFFKRTGLFLGNLNGILGFLLFAMVPSVGAP